MTETSWPSPVHTDVVEPEYEALVAPQYIDGIIGTPTDPLPIYADSTGMQIKVRAGRYGMVRGFLWSSGADEFTVPIAANGTGSTRIDLVVLRLDRSTWTVTLVVKPGSPGSAAPTPTLGTGTTGVYEVPIGTVTVAGGAATIAAGNVTARAWRFRGGWNAPWGVIGGKLYTSSGATLATGVTTEAFLNMDTGSVVTVTGRRYRITARVKASLSDGSSALFRIKLGSASLGYDILHRALGGTGHMILVEGYYTETLGQARTFNLHGGVYSGGGSLTLSRDTTSGQEVLMQVEDLGPNVLTTA